MLLKKASGFTTRDAFFYVQGWTGIKLLRAFSALPTSMWVVFRKEPGRRCGYAQGMSGMPQRARDGGAANVQGWTGIKLLRAFSALPPSDLHGWRKCNRIIGTILAMAVGIKLLHAFSALPPSMAVGIKLLHAFSTLPPSMAVVFHKEPGRRYV